MVSCVILKSPYPVITVASSLWSSLCHTLRASLSQHLASFHGMLAPYRRCYLASIYPPASTIIYAVSLPSQHPPFSICLRCILTRLAYLLARLSRPAPSFHMLGLIRQRRRSLIQYVVLCGNQEAHSIVFFLPVSQGEAGNTGQALSVAMGGGGGGDSVLAALNKYMLWCERQTVLKSGR